MPKCKTSGPGIGHQKKKLTTKLKRRITDLLETQQKFFLLEQLKMCIILSLCIVFAVLASSVSGFVAPSSQARKTLQKPLQESFGLQIATLNDPTKVTPPLLFGETSVKGFVGSYDKNALLLSEKSFAVTDDPKNQNSGPYDIIERVRSLQLLSLTADSGLLEALEDKGITLSQIEKILPIVDDLGLLPLVAKNKGLLLSLAPLIIESAPSAIPLIVSVLRTPAVTFQAAGVALAGFGAYETVLDDNLIVGVPTILLGAPLVVLGTVLSSLGSSLPSARSYSSAAGSGGARSSKKAKKSFFGKAPTVKSSGATSAPGAVKDSVSRANKTGLGAFFYEAPVNGRRKVVRV